MAVLKPVANSKIATASIALAGGWFLGGIGVAVASGGDLARMFRGSAGEQAAQLAAALAAVAVILGF